MRRSLRVATLVTPLAAAFLPAQDTVSLRALHEAAMARDARAGARDLLHTASRLRDQVIAGDRYARPLLAGQLTHQSDVTALPVRLPGSDVPTPPFTRYQAVLELDQPLYDAGAVRARRSVERARTTEADADVQARLYGVTAEVNAALFTLLLQQAQEDALAETLAVFDAQLAEARVRVAEGAALARDTSLLVAERLRMEEQRELLRTRRNVARAQLRSLTGRDVGERPALPALDAFAAARPATLGDDTPRTRPEFGRFEATRARLAEEVRATAVESRPRVSAFVQGGFGRPGLNQLRPDTDAFYLAGVRVAWRPLANRDAERSAEALRVQQRLIDLEAQAFADQLTRVVLADLADIERLDALVGSDRAQLAARAEVARVAQLELDEGIITTAQWITPQAELADARLAAARHDVERAYAWARLYTTLALPLP
jgi:outer membrane protein TolC